jgi:Cu/Ag efflux pump CusA
VVLSASLEVRNAVVYATFIVVLVFVPVFFLSGLQGRLFAPLGYAYVLAVLASLGVALTVTPALSMLLLTGRREPETVVAGSPAEAGHYEPTAVRSDRIHAVEAEVGHDEPTRLARWLQTGYVWLLRQLDRQLALVLTVTLALIAAAGVALVNFGGQFLPVLRENHFVVHMRGTPGTSLPRSLDAGNKVNRALQSDPFLRRQIRTLAQEAGRAELGEDTWGVDYSEIEVDLKHLNAAGVGQVEKQLRATLGDETVGFSFVVMPFLTERIKETISGSSASVAVKVYGDDLEALDRAAQSIARALARVPGSDAVRPEAQTGAPELVIRIRPKDANRYNLRNAQILDALHAAYQGGEVGQTYLGNRVIDLVVILESRTRANPDAVANLWLSVPDKGNGPPGRVQLKQVADVYLSDGRFLIAHEGARRRQVVTCDVLGRDVESFVADAQKKVQELTLPAGVSYVFTGEHEAKQTAQRELLLLGMATLAGILLLLGMVFRSLVLLLLVVLVNLPFALVGGVAAVYLTGGVLDVGSLVGFVTLFGISTRNGIMMVSHWQHLHEVEGMPWGRELVFRGARERLAPVLMTALVTALGLLPIALGSGEAGREIEGPMAVVILGGLVTSTVLNLLVLPVLYRALGQRSRYTAAERV